MTRRLLIAIFLTTLAASPLLSQEMLTAGDFFDRVSERYTEIVDYTADLTIETEESTQSGELFYRRPNLIRINFEEPDEQVLVSDGETLQVYIPTYNVVLSQELLQEDGPGPATMANAEGLELMRRNYSIAYLDSPELVPLDEDSEEMVTELLLTWRSTNEGYRQLTLSIDEDLLIRRIVGVTIGFQEVRFDFADVRLNQNIPVARFDYEAPSSANTYEDFLFEGDN
ncbi:MAG: LolA family protein [Alkalispirochaetaceae bacterium]